MPDLWMPGATRLDIGDHSPTDGGPAKAIPHITWDRNATAANPAPLVPYETLVQYFGRNPAGMKAAPHVLWDPFTGRVTQFVPATSRSKSLADGPGGTRTNRAGRVVLQIEALFFPYCVVGGRTYARLVDTPCKGWPELLAWIRSWGVPDRWPNGRPENCTRNAKNWETEAGWFPHAAVPENDHGDPLSWPAFITDQEDDAMTPEQARQLKELHSRLVPYAGWSYKGEGVPVDAYADLRTASAQSSAAARNTAGLASKIDGLKTTALTDAQVTSIAAKVAANPALAERIAELVADKLADRLAN
ncbi:hypothetical protein VWBp52 [Streptomyces phage VWB]|uniref:Endolysin n=1 Tax=Streptomyces phage VWB TaxID=10702 RepID=Q6VY37_9CAUD|nr:hypothetical protein VWBp52 [Streptomyces phage VWB]AAR29740.1 hypothetical protein [Streptomyces phage VWB]